MKPRHKEKMAKPPMSMKGAAHGAGKQSRESHKMGGMFGVTPKKSEPDDAPPTRMQRAAKHSARMKRLKGVYI